MRNQPIEEAIAVVQELLCSAPVMSASVLQDRLVEIAGSRSQLTRLLQALGSLPRPLVEAI